MNRIRTAIFVFDGASTKSCTHPGLAEVMRMKHDYRIEKRDRF